MAKSLKGTVQRRKLLGEIERLAEIAIFGTLSETYRTCGRAGCHCQGDGPKHGPHLNVSYRGEKGKTTGYYVPKAAEEATREGVAAWQQVQQCLRELAELNKGRAICNGPARLIRNESMFPSNPRLLCTALSVPQPSSVNRPGARLTDCRLATMVRSRERNYLRCFPCFSCHKNEIRSAWPCTSCILAS